MTRLSLYIVLLLGLHTPLNLLAQETDLYEDIKKDILCKTIDFCLNENISSKETEVQVNCSSLDSIAASIPKEYASTLRIMRIFKNKKYESYGKNRTKARLDKLLQDIESELLKLRRDKNWKQMVKVFVIELQSIRERGLEKSQKKSEATLDSASTKKESPIPASPQDKAEVGNQNISKNTPTSSMLAYFLILALMAGLAFLYYQLKELQKQIAELQAQMEEKYSRLDNRLDTFTPQRDHQALIQKVAFLNDQISAIIQELALLKTRNQYKISPEEVYAQRTEHLEKQKTRPEVRIFYASLHTDSQTFEEQDWKTEPSKEHCFKIEISPKSPNEARLSITDRSEYHHKALEEWETMLLPVAEFDYPPHNDTKIITFESGRIHKQKGVWQVEQKIKIFFE